MDFVQVRKKLCAESDTDTYHLEEAIRKTFDLWQSSAPLPEGKGVEESETAKLLYRKLKSLRLEVHESIVNDIQQTVDKLISEFATPNPSPKGNK